MTTEAPNPTIIAEQAFDATTELPCFDGTDRLAAMLEHITEASPELDDDTQAAVIRACREKAGLECRPAIN